MMKLIAASDVEKHLTPEICLAAVEAAMIATSAQKVELPIRQFMPIPDADGKLALMPGAMSDPNCFGIKLVCKYNRPADSPLGTHVGMVMLFDSDKGVPLAMIEGASLTGIRTAAASALATKLLARDDSKALAILGTGEQAKRHVRAMLGVRDISSIRVWGRTASRVQEFCREMGSETGCEFHASQSVEQAVSSADIICTTTSSKRPILKGEWVPKGCHLNLVGAAIPTSSEVDAETVKQSKYFVDYRPAAHAAAGELLDAVADNQVGLDHILAEIGEVATGTVQGRTSDEDITLYKSLGIAAQDLAAAHYLYKEACEKDFGSEIDLLA